MSIQQDTVASSLSLALDSAFRLFAINPSAHHWQQLEDCMYAWQRWTHHKNQSGLADHLYGMVPIFEWVDLLAAENRALENAASGG